MPDFSYPPFTQSELDRAYDSDAAVPACSAIMRALKEASVVFRAGVGGELDLRYGPGARETLDFYPARQGRATLVFFHGGNWRSGSKEAFAALAQGPLARGFNVAMVGYPLAPVAPMAEIVQAAQRAVSFLTARGGPRLVLSGWSAGAQLAALCLAQPGIVGLLGGSGLYDLAPIQQCYLNQDLKLTPEDARFFSPARQVLSGAPPFILAVGEEETSELLRQSTACAAAWREAGQKGRLDILRGHNHFSLLEEFGPEGKLTQQLCDLAA